MTNQQINPLQQAKTNLVGLTYNVNQVSFISVNPLSWAIKAETKFEVIQSVSQIWAS